MTRYLAGASIGVSIYAASMWLRTHDQVIAEGELYGIGLSWLAAWCASLAHRLYSAANKRGSKGEGA